MPMRRMVLLLVLPLLAACGQDPTAPPDHHSSPGAEDSVAAPIAHPAGADDVVVRIRGSIGMGTADMAFRLAPTLVVTGSGTTYVTAPRYAQTDHPVTAMLRFSAGEAGVQELLARAREDGLLASPPDYTSPETVADAGDTTVTLDADGHVWTHTANALGILDSDTEARNRLDDFARFAVAWGRQVRTPRSPAYRPQTLRVMARLLPFTPGTGIEVGTWPADAAERLSDLADCSLVHDPVLVRMLTTSSAVDYREGGATYVVAAAPMLPGDSCSGEGGS